MPFERITPEKLSSSVVRQIEQLILRGILRPSERLPSERELSERLGVSRPSLREAIAQMQETGLLFSKPGAGIFVSDSLNAIFPAPLAHLFATHDEAVFDYLHFRRDIEGLASERAAKYGSDTDLKLIDTLVTKMEEAHEAGDAVLEGKLDAQFHLAIGEASHNVVMLHMMRSMFQLLHTGVVHNREQVFSHRALSAELLEQHKQINAALQRRDPAAARKASEDHLTHIEAAMRTRQQQDHNEAIAQKRFSTEFE